VFTEKFYPNRASVISIYNILVAKQNSMNFKRHQLLNNNLKVRIKKKHNKVTLLERFLSEREVNSKRVPAKYLSINSVLS